jgi:(1->4)-alpha-D-glucan 1-alpha-D-glucosylmutase
LISVVLKFRGKLPELFTVGQYIPLEVQGSRSSNVVAFARQHGKSVAITVAPRMVAATIFEEGNCDLNCDLKTLIASKEFWGDTTIELPAELPQATLQNVFTLQSVPVSDAKLLLSDILQKFPVALLYATQ